MMFHAQIAQRAFNTQLLVEPSKAMAFLSGLGPRITGRQLRLAGLEVSPEDKACAALPARAGILTNLSRALYRSGQPARAVEVADRALVVAERLDLEEILAEAFNNTAAGLSYLGRTREAVALMEAAIRVAETGGFRNAELRARNNLAVSRGAGSPRAPWRSSWLRITSHIAWGTARWPVGRWRKPRGA